MAKPSITPVHVPIKGLLIGDSGNGKTGALASLAQAGYRLMVLDFDGDFANSYCVNYLRERAPAALENVHYVTLRDKRKLVGAATVADGTPKAFSRGLNLLSHWKDDEEDLGPNTTWDQRSIIVIDSLSKAAEAAFDHNAYLSPTKDPRQTYFAAQQMIDDLLMMLTSDDIRCNVLVLSHITYLEIDQGIMRGFPKSIGKASAPDIPKSFNIMLECIRKGIGSSATRVIRTVPSVAVANKQPLPSGVPDELPLTTGLADYFKKYHGALPAGE